MTAAHAVQKPLTTVKALDLPWSVFQQSEEMSAMMASAAKTCQHLAIEMNLERPRKKGRAGLAKTISSSPSLHTLEISLGFLYVEMKLSKLFDADAHWPNLRRLKLQALGAMHTSLMKLLTTHAPNLQSLELAHIDFEPHQLDGKECRCSWVDFLIFIQKSPSLKIVHLDGNLCNGWDEA